MTTCKTCGYREGAPHSDEDGACYGAPPTPAFIDGVRRNIRPMVGPRTQACSLYRIHELLVGHDGREKTQ